MLVPRKGNFHFSHLLLLPGFFYPDPPVAFFGAQKKTALFLGGFSSSTPGFQPEEASGSDFAEGQWMLEGDFLVGVPKGGCSRGRGATGEP